MITTALARRPDILTAYAAQKAANANVDAAVAEFLPKVFVSGTTAYNPGSLFGHGHPGIGAAIRNGESQFFSVRQQRSCWRDSSDL